MNSVDDQQLLKDIAQKEMSYGLYDAKIKGLPIYSFIRFFVRNDILNQNGFPVLKPRQRIKRSSVIKSALISIWHFLKLFLLRSHYSTVFYSFPRVEKIGNEYIDKFTDPIIDCVEYKDDIIILEHGRAGVHPTPRIHKNKIVYLDVLSVYSNVIASLYGSRFYNKYRIDFDQFYNSLNRAFDNTLKIERIVKLFYSNYLYNNGLYKILKCMSAKRLIGPSRSYMFGPFYAAHLLGIKTFELQHGVTYGETVTYSGYRDPMVMPDVFLAFGDNKPSNVYGIDERRIVNIGWALQDYLAKLPHKDSFQEKDILVISDPEVTNAIFEVVLRLAEDNPESTFYIRPHPHENITEQQLCSISSKRNIKIQDKSINITVVLQGFNHVVGENSTVLYEALAINKKVGRLFYKGLNPKYLEESDKDCFWEIHNQEEFERFLCDDISAKKSKSIYSKFNRELFCKTIGIEA